MTQEPLYLVGHPKRIEQDSQRTNIDAPSSSKKKKKKIGAKQEKHNKQHSHNTTNMPFPS